MMQVNEVPELSLLAQYQVEVMVIATFFIALSAVVTAFLTKELASENKKLRRAETDPEVQAGAYETTAAWR